MRRIISFVMVIALLSWYMPQVHAISGSEKKRGYSELPQSKLLKKAAEYEPLQPLIDETAYGGILMLEAKNYAGPVVIDKPITIVGQGEASVLYVTENDEGIQLASDEIKLEQLYIVDERKEPLAAVITAQKQEKLHLEQLHILTGATSVEWRAIIQGSITGLFVSFNGKASASRTSRGNGIYVHSSSDIVIDDNTIEGVYDAIYTENSSNLRISGNNVSNSRYGYHMMYAENVELLNNKGQHNIIGMMVMTSDNIELRDNVLSDHQSNVNAGGILIYDVVNATVANNMLSQNRVAISVERSQSVGVQHNELKHNFVGLQLQRSEQLQLEYNDFYGNVTNVWDDSSSEPLIQHNYWDTLQGLDINGDGYSDLHYNSPPFFLSLIERRPSFQLLFGTPGMLFIEQLFSSESHQWLADSSPSMRRNMEEPTASASGIQWAMLVFWIMLGAGSVYIIITVRRKEI